MNNRVILKPGKEKAILNRHHWIFSGAVEQLPKFTNGQFLPVYSHREQLLGSAYFNKQSGIIGRMVTFDDTEPLEAIKKHLKAAVEYREMLFKHSKTNAYRLVHGEGDFIPGLVVDRYNDVLVIQIATLGIETNKTFIVEWLRDNLQPRTIIERSHQPSRREEGLKDFSGLLYGEDQQKVEVIENGLKFIVDVKEGQKTGFFCDHREMRKMIQALSDKKNVLNCFAYTGGFSVYAMAGGAKNVDSVDISESAMQLAEQNLSLNGFQLAKESFYCEDLFQFLRNKPIDYDIVILDPPAFAKKQKDVVVACRGYKDINRIALQKMKPKSWLLTCSCSFHVDEQLFQKVLFQAAVEAGKKVQIVETHRLAPDHPINICHPETDYLKSFLLYVS